MWRDNVRRRGNTISQQCPYEENTQMHVNSMTGSLIFLPVPPPKMAAKKSLRENDVTLPVTPPNLSFTPQEFSP